MDRANDSCTYESCLTDSIQIAMLTADLEIRRAYALLPTPQSNNVGANLCYWRGKPEPSMHSPSLFGPTFHEECVDDFPNLLPRLSDL